MLTIPYNTVIITYILGILCLCTCRMFCLHWGWFALRQGVRRDADVYRSDTQDSHQHSQPASRATAVA